MILKDNLLTMLVQIYLHILNKSKIFGNLKYKPQKMHLIKQFNHQKLSRFKINQQALVGKILPILIFRLDRN